MLGSQLRERLAALAAGAACLAALAAAGPARAAVEPYGANDSGGFRNVLPPGSKGVDNAADLALFTGTGTYPQHWNDQQPLYDGLLAAEPGLRGADIPDFFKDATFGVRAGDVESTITPRPGVTIIRDRGYGVPHIYGETRADTMFGAGYANAADRLFLMDVLRNTGRAQLSSFIGGSPSNRAMDRDQWQFAPYTDAELLRQFDARGRVLRRRGPPAAARRPRLHRGHQRVRGRRAHRPHAAARRVRRPRQAPDAVERRRPGRRGVADRRDLRQGRRP